MIYPLDPSLMGGALIGINEQIASVPIGDAYNTLINGSYDVTGGLPIGYADYTQNKPAITGDTQSWVTPSSEGVAGDAWQDYVDNNNPEISGTTGGIVSGSNVGTFVYSLLEENPGTAQAIAKAVIPVAVPIDAAITAISQAVGVSVDMYNLNHDVATQLREAVTNLEGAVYDKAKGLLTAWKDEWGRILFPKKVVEAIDDSLDSMGIGPGTETPTGSGTYSKYQNVTAYYGTPSGESSSFRDIQLGSSTNAEGFYFIGSTLYGFGTDPNISFTMVGTRKKDSVQVSFPSYKPQSVVFDGVTYYYAASQMTINIAHVPQSCTGTSSPSIPVDIYYNGVVDLEPSGYFPEGTSESEATKYTPSTIPSAGRIATSYDDQGNLGFEDVVPVHITDDPYDATGDTVNPTDPTSVDNPSVSYPGQETTWTDEDGKEHTGTNPVPLPIPDTSSSNPDVPLTESSVINQDLINELVDSLANTLDPNPVQSFGTIPVPPMPGVFDPDTGISSYPSIVPQSGSGFIHVYNPSPGEFVAFGQWLWVTYADATQEKIWNNPFDGVIGAHELYSTPQTDGSDNIRSGFLVCPTTAALVRQRYTEIDCGTIIVPEFYGNYLDYSPYSQCYVYLPFIGINEISIDDIMGKAVNIRYRIDAYSGSCIAMIFVAQNGYQNLCYQFGGNCAVEVPLAGGSQAAIKAGMMQAEAYARAAMPSAIGNAFGGIASGLMGSIGGLIGGISGAIGNYANAKAGVEAAKVANKSSVQHSGSFGASHGAMGEKIPFIIIRTPVQVKVVNYNDDYGFPAHKRVIIGGCHGYLRVKEVNVISAHATDDEKAMIEAMLKNGVYVD